MSNIENYKEKLGTIQAIPDDEIRTPGIPVDVFLQEAENPYQWCLADKEKLEAAGLDWTFVDDLPVRAGAAREAESRWVKERFTRKDAEKEWQEKTTVRLFL